MFIRLHIEDDDKKCPLININCIRDIDTYFSANGGCFVIEIAFQDGETKRYTYPNSMRNNNRICQQDYEMLTEILLGQTNLD